MARKIVLYELNEVPIRIVDSFCQWRPKSTLATLLPRCHQYETYTEDEGVLSPWITWPTLHRGVVDRDHLIFEFGQDLADVDSEFPPLWKILASHGVSTGVCGSLHSNPMPEDLNGYSFYLPDTFAAGSECFPSALSSFQDFNLLMARASARDVSRSVPWASALRFLASAPSLGIKPKTVLDVGIQLASERVRRARRVRRRTFQATLSFDIFLDQIKKTLPAFSTYFTNHVASSMHRYWAAAFPNDYETFGYDAEWVKTFAEEIEFTMRKADECIAHLVRFVNKKPEYQLWIATSMGQAATVATPTQTQLYIKDRRTFLSHLGLQDGDWTEVPAMLPKYSFRVADNKVARFRQRAGSVCIDGEPLQFSEGKSGFVSVRLGQRDLTGDCVTVNDESISLDEMGLENRMIEDQTRQTAYHIPHGCLFIYDPQARRVDAARTTISTLDIAPTILRNFDVSIPSYMNRSTAIGGLKEVAQ